MTQGQRTTPESPMTWIQSQTLDWIAAFIEQRGYPPTCRDIKTEFGVVSANTVRDRLLALEKRGLITRVPRLARSIALTPLGREKTGRGARSHSGTSIDRTSPSMPGHDPAPVASPSEGDNT